jgi:hypothetical protein
VEAVSRFKKIESFLSPEKPYRINPVAMTPTKLLLQAVILLLSLPLFCQSTATVNFMVQPAHGVMRIDDSIYVDLGKERLPYPMSLPAGAHIIELWAPRFSAFRDTFEVKSEGVQYYRMGLKTVNPAFQQYRQDLADYRNNNYTRYGVTAAVIAGDYFLIKAVLAKEDGKRLDELRIESNRLRNEYISYIDPEIIEYFQEKFYETVDEYNRKRKWYTTKRIIAIPTLMALNYLGYRIIRKLHKVKKTEKPVYEEENPLAGFRLQLGSSTGMDIGLHLTF